MERVPGVVLVALFAFAECVQLDEFYPFGESAGDGELERGDDETYGPLRLDHPFPYFDTDERNLYINTNGILSFDAPSSVYSPQSFPLASVTALYSQTYKVIAPFWGDVDTTNIGAGRVWYRQTTDTGQLSRAKEDIAKHSVLYPNVDIRSFDPAVMVVVTWDHVGYYHGHFEKTNTFQCVLVSDENTSFVLFLYAKGKMQWSSADSSGGTNGVGGTPAQAGFNAGDGFRHFSLSVSRTNEILDTDDLHGNTGEEGLWIFRVDGREISSGQCSNNGDIDISLDRGNVLGGTAIVVYGPCFDDFKKVKCTFESSVDSVSVDGIILDNRRSLCIVPMLKSVGRLNFKLKLTDKSDKITDSQRKQFYSIPSVWDHQVDYLNSDLLFEAGSVVSLTWTPSDVLSLESSNAYNIDIALYGLLRRDNVTSWRELSLVATNVSNTGRVNVTIPKLTVSPNHSSYLTIAFQVRLHPLPHTGHGYDQLNAQAGIWTGESYYIYAGKPSRERCIAWVGDLEAREAERQQLSLLPPCPCNLEQAKAPNSGFKEGLWNTFLNPQAAVCYYQSLPLKIASGRQCCYGDDGKLMDSTSGAGRSDFVSLFSDVNSPHLLQLSHFEADIVPYLDCCRSQESLCREYYKYRPSSTSSSCQHNVSIPAFVYGDPHFVSLDGLRYSFNGKGEYTIVKTSDSSFTVQGRLTEVQSTDRHYSTATVLSSLVARQLDSDTVQFEVARRGIAVLINGELTELDIGAQVLSWNVVLSRLSDTTYGVSFSCGAYIEIEGGLDYLSAVVLSLPETFKNHTSGLLGNFNGDKRDDLLPMGASEYLPANSDVVGIHEGFGLSWLVSSQDRSLFTYHEPYETFSTFFDPSFSPSVHPYFESTQLEREAGKLCGGDGSCLYDVAATGRLEVGNQTKITAEKMRELIEVSRQVVCDPPCLYGTCTRNNTCSCHDGYTGETCNTTSIVDGECLESPCLHGGTCKKLRMDSICVCPELASGFNCEKTSPFIFNCTSVLKSERLTVSCSGSKPVTTHVCRVDHGTPQSCSPPLQLNLAALGVGYGQHTLTITATDVTNLNQTALISFFVEPFNFTCKSGFRDEQLMISDCQSNNEVLSVDCLLKKNGEVMTKCELPVVANLTVLRAGEYTFNVSATDVFRHKDAFIVKYTKMPLKLTLINSSPRLWGGTVIADFTVNRETGQYRVSCLLRGHQEKDCTDGRVRFDGVPRGRYILRLIATSRNGERHVIRRNLFIGYEDDYCAAHLINEGVEVKGQSVKVQFYGTQSTVSYYRCKLDNQPFIRCRSPYKLEGLEPGHHRIRILPVCQSPDHHPYRTTARFVINS